MKTDLSRSLRHLLDGALDRARRLQQAGQPHAAADAWDEAARLTEQLSASAATPGEQQRRQVTAREFRQTAQELRTRPIATRSVNESPVTDAASPDEYRTAVQGLIHRSTISWNEIAGLEETKAAIQTAYALSLAELPPGIKVQPVRNLLLYGPPGNGKTLLAAACSQALEATFFNVKVSHLLSKYFGESSKLVTALYEEARARAPSVIFLDEVDALTGTRQGNDAGAERRMLANLLAELDGMSEKDSSRFVMTLAATNAPWSMDPAILSRFERKVLVPLPDDAARGRILELQLAERGYTVEMSPSELVARTSGFSGRELERFAKLLIERMLQEQNPGLPQAASQGRTALAAYRVRMAPISRRLVNEILQQIRPETSAEQLRRYAEYSNGTR